MTTDDKVVAAFVQQLATKIDPTDLLSHDLSQDCCALANLLYGLQVLTQVTRILPLN
jgi:hypothetical protein